MAELPQNLVQVLTRIAAARRTSAAFHADIAQFNQLAARLGPENYMSYARQIRQVAKLWPYRPAGLGIGRFCVTEPDLPLRVPGAAWLYLFHSAGRHREAALGLIPAVIPSSFHLYALIYRQNDWAAPVRAAAAEAMARVDTRASALPITIAALALWVDVARWGRGTPQLVINLLREAPVFDATVRTLEKDGTARGLAALRQMLRYDAIDPHLERLFFEARAPAIRRLALTTLRRGEARVLTGYRRAWVDKSLGRTRPEPVFDTRPLTVAPDTAALCLAALDDRALQVRAAALDGLMDLGATSLIPENRLEAMAKGPHYKLAWRADYIRRKRSGI